MTDDTSAEADADPTAVRSPMDASAPAAEPPRHPTPGGSSPGSAPDRSPVEAPRQRRVRRKGSFWRELPVLLLIALVLAVLIKTFLVQAFFIPSSSMEKTLHGCPGCSGDRVLVNKLTHRFRDPKPGEIVVFRGPESWAPEVHIEGPSNILQRGVRAVGQVIGIAQPNEKDFIKRVIAVGGQTVQCCDARGRVLVDGRPLDEPYIYRDGQEDPRLSQFGPIQVPAGRLWVMGDHRNASADSRAHLGADLGTISVHDVVGKAFIIVWPPSRWDTLGTPSTFQSLGAVATSSTPSMLSAGLVLPLGWARWRRRKRRRGNRGTVPTSASPYRWPARPR
jgi:signal peptidase I